MFNKFIKQFWHIDKLVNVECFDRKPRKKLSNHRLRSPSISYDENSSTNPGVKLCHYNCRQCIMSLSPEKCDDDIQRLIDIIWFKAYRYNLDADQVMASIEQCLRPEKNYPKNDNLFVSPQIGQKHFRSDNRLIRNGHNKALSQLSFEQSSFSSDHHQTHNCHNQLSSLILIIPTVIVSILVLFLFCCCCWLSVYQLSLDSVNGSLLTVSSLYKLLLSVIGTDPVSASWNTRRCLVPNNYLVKEIARPVANCDQLCRSVDSFHILHNRTVDRDRFASIAYDGRPIVVRDAATDWPAMQTFNFDFFRQIYTQLPGAYSGVDEECQFFPFRTNFRVLSEVFEQPESDIRQSLPNSKSWYIGWSNCNPDVADILRQYYQRPWFLPDDSEHSIIDWIFMGYTEIGASMHLDYVQRPSWQAQISGTKTWHLIPPPECELLCQPINVTVYKGDIILLDTNQWYHDTHIHPGEISITIGSEYD